MNFKSYSILFFFGIMYFVSLAKLPPEKAVAKPEITKIEFGSIVIDNITYDDDVIIDKGEVKKRKKGDSRNLREQYGHTPLTSAENIPWNCDTLIIGIGMSGRLPVTDEFKKEAEKRKVALIFLETPEAVKYFTKHYYNGMNAVFHITC